MQFKVYEPGPSTIQHVLQELKINQAGLQDHKRLGLYPSIT